MVGGLPAEGAGDAQRRDDHEPTSLRAVQLNMSEGLRNSAMALLQDEIRKRIRTNAGLETKSSTECEADRVPNNRLKLTKSPLRWTTVERRPTGAFAA